MLMHDSKAGPETTPRVIVQRAGGCEVLPRGVGWVGALDSFHTVAAIISAMAILIPEELISESAEPACWVCCPARRVPFPCYVCASALSRSAAARVEYSSFS